MSVKFTTLTRASIRSLLPGQKLAEHGITAERTKNGDIAYRVNIMVDGERIHRVVGRESDGVTRQQAEEMIATLRTRAREERLDLPKGRKTYLAFEEAGEEYLTRLEGTGGKDMKNKRRHIEQRLTPHFGKIRCDKITTLETQMYVQKRLASGAKQATVNRELATLSHFLNRAAEWKWIKLDDRPRIAKGTEPRKPIAVLSDQQSANLMAAAYEDIEQRLYLFVAFGLNAAMRHSEIVAARYDQVDFENRRIFIPQAKAGAREQPITPSLASLLSERRKTEADRNGWIFPSINKSKYPHRKNLDAAFKRAAMAAGLDSTKVTPHVMRHTAITRLVQAGIDLPTIQRISGHKTLTMVLRYTHVHAQHIDQALEALDTGQSKPNTPKLHMEIRDEAA